MNYSRELRLAKWGSEVKLQCKNSEAPMSQLGQPHRFEPISGTFAYPPTPEVADPFDHLIGIGGLPPNRNQREGDASRAIERLRFFHPVSSIR